jgi:hypothetical protein
MFFRRWTLDARRWTLDVGRWTLDFSPLKLALSICVQGFFYGAWGSFYIGFDFTKNLKIRASWRLKGLFANRHPFFLTEGLADPFSFLLDMWQLQGINLNHCIPNPTPKP